MSGKKRIRKCLTCERVYVEHVPSIPSNGEIPLDFGYAESLCPDCQSCGSIIDENPTAETLLKVSRKATD